MFVKAIKSGQDELLCDAAEGGLCASLCDVNNALQELFILG